MTVSKGESAGLAGRANDGLELRSLLTVACASGKGYFPRIAQFTATATGARISAAPAAFR